MEAETPQLTPQSKGKLRRQTKFLKEYAISARISVAAEQAEIDRWTHYEWLKTDPDYAVRFRDTKELAIQQLEDEAIRRAKDGIDRPITVAGERVDVKEFSDTLLIFMLKAMRPDVYRDRQSIEHTGAGGKPLLDIAAVDELIRQATAEK